MILLDRAIQYAEDVKSSKEITTWEVKKQCEIFLNDYNKRQYENDWLFYFDEKKLKLINNLLKLLNYATGFVAGKQVLEYLSPYQCFLITNIFAWRYKDNPSKFKHNDITLFISRKNAKTATVAIIFILLMLTEQNYSEFYSICLTKELAAELRKNMVQILEASPYISKHFNISKTFTGVIECKITHSWFQPRTAESGKNNSIRPSAFVSDEHANFNNTDNFEAMKGGQKNVINPLVFRTTTAYAINNSIMEEDIDYIRKVFNGVVEDERQFALLYYAEKEHIWDDIGIYQSNPLRIEENYDIIRDNRKKALLKPSRQKEYITKDMNNFLQENEDEPYLDYKVWEKGRLDKINLKGIEVIVGVDASLTTDLTAIVIMFKKDGKYYIIAHAYLPRNSLIKRREKIDYIQMERQGYCTITDGDIVDYNLIESEIRGIEDKYNCTIKSIVSDPYNITAVMQKLSEEYDVILLKQTYGNLSPAIKDFQQEVYKGNVFYQENKILDWCVSCATTIKGKVSGDVLLAKENKNKQRIDLIVATIFCHTQLYLQNDEIELTEDYIASFYNR